MAHTKYNINSLQSFSSRLVSGVDYLIVAVFILYAGRGNTFFESGSLTQNPFGVALPLFLGTILALRWRIVFNSQFYLLIFFYFAYFIAITIKFGEFRPTIFMNYIFIFFMVYTIVKALKKNLFIIYEKVLYVLSIIGLALWGFQVILGGDTLFSIISHLPNISTFSNVSSQGLNIIIYSIQPSISSMVHGVPIPRNCGYAWEPGAFAVFISLAIYINLFFINNDSGRRKRFWILLIALISTQSTTGYMILLLILFFFLLNKRVNTLILLSPILIIILGLLFSLPFMGEKIADVYRQVAEIDLIIENSVTLGTSYAPGRFASFVIAFKDFLDNPILGLGSVNEQSWTYKLGASIGSISGIGNLLAQFGLIGFLFFTFTTIMSSILYAKMYNYRGKLFFFLIILMISVSYSILFLPIVMSFWAFYFFNPRETTDNGATRF